MSMPFLLRWLERSVRAVYFLLFAWPLTKLRLRVQPFHDLVDAFALREVLENQPDDRSFLRVLLDLLLYAASWPA